MGWPRLPPPQPGRREGVGGPGAGAGGRRTREPRLRRGGGGAARTPAPGLALALALALGLVLARLPAAVAWDLEAGGNATCVRFPGAAPHAYKCHFKCWGQRFAYDAPHREYEDISHTATKQTWEGRNDMGDGIGRGPGQMGDSLPFVPGDCGPGGSNVSHTPICPACTGTRYDGYLGFSVGGRHACMLVNSTFQESDFYSGNIYRYRKPERYCWGNENVFKGEGYASSNQHHAAMLSSCRDWSGSSNCGIGGEGPSSSSAIFGQSFVQLSAHGDGTCGVTNTGRVQCWGVQPYGSGSSRLGQAQNWRGDDTVNQRVDFGEAANYTGLGWPWLTNRHDTGIATGIGVASVTVGPHSTCAIFGDGRLKCIGRNAGGALGYGDTLDRGSSSATLGSNLPFVTLPVLRTVRAVGVGLDRMCAVLDDGSVRVWGVGFNGRAIWTGTTEAKDVACALNGCCLLFNTGGVRCFGAGGAFMGYGDMTARETVSDFLPYVDLGEDTYAVRKVTAGDRHVCALTMSDKVRCWGENEFGQLGYGDTLDRGSGAGQTGAALPDVLTHVPLPIPPPPAPPPPPPPPPLQDLAFVEAHANWNCTLVAGEVTFCPEVLVPLEAVGPASVGYKLVMDGSLVAANTTEGVIPAGEIETVGLDVVEARLAAGRTQINVKVYTTEVGSRCAAPSVPDTVTVYGYTCHHSTIPLVVDMGVSSGLVVFPGAHEVAVALDNTADAQSTVLFVDFDNTAPYSVDMSPTCASFLSMPNGQNGSLARMLQQELLFHFTPAETDLDFATGEATNCSALVRRMDAADKNETLTFQVSGQRGAPSTQSILAPVNTTAAGETTFTITPKDRLGNACDQAWPGFTFSLKAADGNDVETAIPGSTIRAADGSHQLVVPSLQLDSGTYSLKGFVSGPGVPGSELLASVALNVQPVTCALGSTAASNGMSCMCQAGYFGSDGSCQQCNVGSYKEDAGDAVGCSPCPGGSTTPGTGTTSNTACEAPENSVVDEASENFVCKKGYYGSASSGCEACGLNSYKADAGDAVGCMPCPEGGTTTATASISTANCTCPASTQLDSDVNKCLCLEGYYGSGGSCAACGLGSYKEDVGNALGCSDCPEGGLTVSTGSTSASECSCPLGSELDAVGMACLCSAGYFGSDGECQACSKGSYKVGLGNAVGCNQCPNGSTTGGTGSMSGDSCEAPLHSTVDPISGNFVCLAGYFGSAASSCERCPAGTYKDVAGDMAACTDCIGIIGEGGTTLGTGADAASDCVCRSGFFQVQDSSGGSVCFICPEGATCDGRGAEAIILKPGFWRSSPSSLMLHECERPQGVDLCRGSVDVTIAIDPAEDPEGYERAVAEARAKAATCREGHRGFLCFDCLENYGKRLGLCEPCGTGKGANAVAVTFGAAAVMLAVFLLVSKNLRSALEREGEGDPLGHGGPGLPGAVATGGKAVGGAAKGHAAGSDPESLTVSIFKVIVTWLQLSSLAASVKVPMSAEVQEMLEYESLGNVSPFSFSSFNCVAQVNYYQRFYLCAAVPLMCVGLSALVLAARVALGRKRQRGLQFDTFVMITQMLLFLTYTMVTESVMSVFKCRELDASGLSVLSADVSVQCGTPEHRQAVSAGVAMLFLHTLGVPLQAAFQMWRYRARLGEAGMRVRYSFYFENYRGDLYWYECFGMMRKAGLVAAVTLLQDRVGMQVFTVSWVALVYLTMHTHFKPYEVAVLNELETGALFLSAATLISCVFFFTLPDRPDAVAHSFERGVSWILVLLSLGFILWAAGLIALDLFSNQLKRRGLLSKLPERMRQCWPFSALTQCSGAASSLREVRSDLVMLSDEERARARTMVVENPLSEAIADGRIGRTTSARLPKEVAEEYMPTALVDGGRHTKLNPLSTTAAADPPSTTQP